MHILSLGKVSFRPLTDKLLSTIHEEGFAEKLQHVGLDVSVFLPLGPQKQKQLKA